MAVYQISRIQHRRGTSGELPDALADGEIGMTTDTGEVFIGASDHPAVSGRKSYPYQNIKILTELDVQRGIKGDVYYHGALVGARCPRNGVWSSVVPLFAHSSRDFATYDFALSANNRSTKVVGTLSVCVHPTDPDQSIVTVKTHSVMGWSETRDYLDTIVGDASRPGKFKLTRFDNEGLDSGVTWLSFLNDVPAGSEFILSVSGREWSNPSV
jgi:hypothetical protein